MVRVLFILFISRVASELRSIQHMYLARKSRSNSIPKSTAYMYSQVDNIPGSHISFGDRVGDVFVKEPTEKYTNSLKFKEDVSILQYTTPTGTLKPGIETSISFTDYPISKYSANYEIAKAEAKYNAKFLPSKIETDAKYARLKSMMHFHPPITSNDDTMGFENSEYRVDNDDVRTRPEALYHGWPYFYHTPYKYEHMKIGSEIDKAQEKRHVGENYIIPVHENSNEYLPYSYKSLATIYPEHTNIITTTDNPNGGNQPFFSFVLNDYFNNGKEDDTFVFKEYDWSKEFDDVPLFVDLDEYGKRIRRLGNNYTSPFKNDGTLDSLIDYSSPKILSRASTINKNNDQTQELVTHEHSFHKNDENLLGYKLESNKNKGFKDFIDAFVNKFGKEVDNKNSKSSLKEKQDNGEKKNSFRKVYHINKYQEEDKLYDNKNSSVGDEEIRNSTAYIGGSELLSKAQSKVLSDKKSNAYDITDNKANKHNDNGYWANGIIKGEDGQLNKYKDVAEKVALSNNDDYYLNFEII